MVDLIPKKKTKNNNNNKQIQTKYYHTLLSHVIEIIIQLFTQAPKQKTGDYLHDYLSISMLYSTQRGNHEKQKKRIENRGPIESHHQWMIREDLSRQIHNYG